MPAPPPKPEATPQSRAAERHTRFSIEPPPPPPGPLPSAIAGAPSFLSLDADPDFLPSLSRSNRLWSRARDPFCLYVYWRLSLPIHRFPGARLALAVHRAGGAHESTALLDLPAGTRFVAVSAPDTLYHLSLGFLPHGKIERRDMLFVVAQLSVRTPRPIAAAPPAPQTGAAGRGDVFRPRAGRSPEVLALLFPHLAPGAAPVPGASGNLPRGAANARLTT